MTGIPVQVKDLICTAGIPTTCASRMLEDYIPVYDATAYRRIRDRGAVLLGKGNMDEFGMGSSCENSAFFPTGNPWDLSRVPGGSSGGGAAAVASGEAPYALGSDTGGSIRQPAAMCGVVGLKPTYGLVSRYGLVAYASSLDQIGPIARSVADCALVLEALAGHDPRDATTLPDQPRDYVSALTGDIRGMRIGVPEEYFGEGTQPGVSSAVREAISVLESLGAAAFPVSLPTTPHALACYYIIAPSECSANLARYDGVKYGYSFQDTNDTWEAMEQTRERGFGMEVKRRIMLGAYALSSGYYDAYYLKAQQVRTLIREDFARVFPGGRRPGDSHLPGGRLPEGREGQRPGADVSDRCLHPSRQHRRSPRHIRPLRLFRRVARRNAAHRPPPLRTGPPQPRPRLRAGDGLAHNHAAAVSGQPAVALSP